MTTFRPTFVVAMLVSALCGPAIGQFPGPAISKSEARETALRILIASSTSTYANLRSNTIEAMEIMPDRALPLITSGLSDHNPAVRFAAVVVAGKLNFTSLIPAIGPMTQDENPSVRAAAIYALHRLGRKINITPLGDMLHTQDSSLRANVALILGLMGNPDAVPMLKSAAAVAMPRASEAEAAVVRCQIAEAIVLLGDDSELNTLRAGVYNSVGEVRVISINALGAVADKRMIPALENLLGTPNLAPEPIEVRIAAAAAIARMGSDAGIQTMLNACKDPNEIVRSQTAWGLGWFRDPVTLPHLFAMLNDPSPAVRVAAAASVLRRTSPSN